MDDKLIINIELDKNDVKLTKEELASIKTEAEKDAVVLEIQAKKEKVKEEIEKVKQDMKNQRAEIEIELGIKQAKQDILDLNKAMRDAQKEGAGDDYFQVANQELIELTQRLNEIKATAQDAINLSDDAQRVRSLNQDLSMLDNNLKAVKTVKIDTSEAQAKVGRFASMANSLQGALARAPKGVQTAVSLGAKGLQAYQTTMQRLGTLATQVGSKIRQAFDSKKAVASSAHLNRNFGLSLRSALRMGGALLGMESAFTLIRRASMEFMNNGTAQGMQMKSTFEGITTAISNLLAPAIMFIVQILGTALSYVNAILKAFFGIELSTKKTKANTGGVASNMKDANKELAGFDKINKLGDSGSGSGGGGGGAIATPQYNFEAIDVTPLKNAVDIMMQALTPFIETMKSIDFEPLQTAIRNFGSQAITALTPIGELLAYIINYGLGPFIKTMAEMVIPTAIQGLADILTNLTPMFEFLRDVGISMLNEFFIPLGGFLAETFNEAMSMLVDIAGMIGEKFADVNAKLKESDGAMKNLAIGLGTLLVAFLILSSPISLIGLAIAGVTLLLIKLWDESEAFRGAIEKIIDAVVDIFVYLGETIGEIVQEVVKEFKEWFAENEEEINQFFEVIKKVVDLAKLLIFGAIGAIGEIIKGLVKDLFNLASNIMGIFGGLVDFITGVFTGNWKKAWDGVVKIFKNIFGGIMEIAKRPINGLIDLLNGFIAGVNKIKIPDWVPAVGGKGINIAKIPRLAQGGIVSRPTFAQIGEAGTEAVMPLENNLEWLDKLADMLTTRLGGGGGQRIVLEVDGKTLAEIVNDANKKKELGGYAW